MMILSLLLRSSFINPKKLRALDLQVILLLFWHTKVPLKIPLGDSQAFSTSIFLNQLLTLHLQLPFIR